MDADDCPLDGGGNSTCGWSDGTDWATMLLVVLALMGVGLLYSIWEFVLDPWLRERGWLK
jgi:hypothetical protein